MYAVIFIGGVVVGLILGFLIGRRNKHLLENARHELAKVKKEALLLHYKAVNFKNHIQKEINDLPKDAKEKLGKVVEDFEKAIKGED